MNNLKIYNKILSVIFCVLVAFIAGSCTVSEWEEGFLPGGTVGNSNGNTGDRTHNEDRRKVLLLYSAGYNSLRNYLLEDIEDLKSGWLPKDYPNHDVLLVYTHTPKSSSAYGIPTTPYLIRYYEGDNGQPVADTLVTYEAGTHSATAEQFHNVLSYVKNNFPAGNYGMVFSSHATGYLPSGFYSKPESYEYIPKKSRMKQFGLGMDQDQYQGFTTSPVPYYAPEYDPSLPLTKSIGQDQVGSAGNYVSYEMELAEFAEAFPMKFDYILFDACLMGGIEVAYELRNVCDRIGFSQTEVLAEGLNYKTLTEHLLKNTVPNPQAVCEDYFSQYIKQSGVYQSATISLIDCRELETLAEVCKSIFTNHSAGIKAIRMSNVQQYYRSNYRYFYDLKSIVQEAGATAQELKSLDEALEKCVIYGAFTPKFMEEFRILTYSGFSMYLPRDLSTAFYFEELNSYYKTLEWNKATGLVK